VLAFQDDVGNALHKRVLLTLAIEECSKHALFVVEDGINVVENL
jgi:hypothetical protein